MKNICRVLNQTARYKSKIRFSDYEFPSTSLPLNEEDYGRPLLVILQEKVYTRTGNISCYFDVIDEKFKGHKIILTAKKNRDYKPVRSKIDMRDVPLGARMYISINRGEHFSQDNHFLVWLRASYAEPPQQ